MTYVVILNARFLVTMRLGAGLFELSARRYEAGPVVVQHGKTTGPATALMYQGLQGFWSAGPVKTQKLFL